jgi:hypothetical protein
MTRRFTVALRVCLSCRRPFGVGLWPWSGAHWTRTHGLCRPCHERLEASFEDEPAAAPVRREGPGATPQP